MTRRFATYTILLLTTYGVLTACSHESSGIRSSSVAPKTAPIDPWVLTTLDKDDTTPALLWNGFVGFRLNRDVSAIGQSMFAIDEYDTTGEEKIRPLASPLPNGFVVNGQTLPITGDYRQSLDMKSGALTTHWASGQMTVDCITVLHPTKRILVQQWILSGNNPDYAVDFDLGAQGKMGQMSMFAGNIVVGPSKIKGKLMVTKVPASNPTINVVLTLGMSPNRLAMENARGRSVRMRPGWDEPPSLEEVQTIEDQTKAIWTDRWKTDIEIDGPVEDQQAIRSFLFYLRSAIQPGTDMSISPFGLSNKVYNGHVFWDSDIWIFPVLALLDPSEAQTIPDYRLATMAAAEANPLIHKPGSSESGQHIKYPWESSVSGKDISPSGWQRELHITGDVAWEIHQAIALGFVPEAIESRLLDLARVGFLMESSGGQGKERDLKDVIGPDENHVGDNDLYTNLLAQWTTNGGTWTENPSRPHFHLPHDSTSLLTYDDDPVLTYKQAAAVLSIYPLQYPPAEQEARVMMSRFPDKVIKHGPAMTESVHAVIWARLGEPDKAYPAWKSSWQPFTRLPLMLFSEKTVKPLTYFTTGAAGSLQTVLFGFLGFRLDSVKEQGAAWSKQLRGDNWLSVKPNLPKEWKSVKLKNFMLLGHRYSLTATHRPNGPDAAQVTQGD